MKLTLTLDIEPKEMIEISEYAEKNSIDNSNLEQFRNIGKTFSATLKAQLNALTPTDSTEGTGE